MTAMIEMTEIITGMVEILIEVPGVTRITEMTEKLTVLTEKLLGLTEKRTSTTKIKTGMPEIKIDITDITNKKLDELK